MMFSVETSAEPAAAVSGAHHQVALVLQEMCCMLPNTGEW